MKFIVNLSSDLPGGGTPELIRVGCNVKIIGLIIFTHRSSGWYWRVRESRVYLRFLIHLMNFELVEIHDRCVLSTSFFVFGGVLSQKQGVGSSNG